MHCRDAELKKLIGSEEGQLDSQSTEAHLETCAICQSRLAELAGEEQLSRDAVALLRTAAESDLECNTFCSAISIELSSLLTMDVSVDTEAIDLNFLDTPSHPELLGRLGRYDVERVIGSGGMGIVLKAHDSELNRVVAIKVLAPHLANSGAARRRFSREARAAAAVLHPNVLPIFNVESDGRTPYFVMQFVAGESLQARVDRQGPLEIPTALRIARQTTAALMAAHSQGLVHRDVKPANILLEECVDRAQLSDFGLARTVDDASLTRTGIVAGTPHYMSPEQASGEPIDARSDLFSLGCTLYFMLAARPPFRAESSMAVLNRICHHPHRPLKSVNSSVPRELSQLVDRLLAKRAAKRFESAEAVESALEQMLAAIQEGRMRIEPSPRLKRSRRRWSVALLAAIAVASLLTTAYFAWRPESINYAIQVAQDFEKLPNSVLRVETPPRVLESTHQSPSEHDRQVIPSTTNAVTGTLANALPPPQAVGPNFDPLQAIQAEDQWKRDLRELNALVKGAAIQNNSWAAAANASDRIYEAQIQSLASQIQSLKADTQASPNQPQYQSQ